VQGVEVDVLRGEPMVVGAVELGASFGPSDLDPVGCRVARPGKPAGFDKGLDERRSVPVSGLLVSSKPTGDPGKDVRGEVRNADLGPDQKAGVSDHELKVGLSCLGVPADVGVSWRTAPRGCCEPERAEGPRGALDEVAELCPAKGRVAEVVIGGKGISI